MVCMLVVPYVDWKTFMLLNMQSDARRLVTGGSERIVTGCYGFRTQVVNTLPVCTRYCHRDSYQT